MEVNFETNSKVLELVDKLKARVEDREITITDEEAQEEIQDALLEYYNDRHYTPTEAEPFEEIYAGIIVRLALSSIVKKGAEGEKSHTEGGVTRSYDTASDYPLSLTQKIIPLAKGL